MKKIVLHISLLTLMVLSCKINSSNDLANKDPNDSSSLEQALKEPLLIHPISHATFVLNNGAVNFLIDPVGDVAQFENYGDNFIVLVTDIHGDHLKTETLEGLFHKTVQIICPTAVFEKLTDSLKSKSLVLKNGETYEEKNYQIEAIPMYNLREEAKNFHEKGRGNGYIITLNNERIYISGDTEDIPEMRALTNIDQAFVCMNLPYTMTVESAADAVLEFKPKRVYPYHYRGKDGFSDVDKFKQLVNNGQQEIEVIQLNWYTDKQE